MHAPRLSNARLLFSHPELHDFCKAWDLLRHKHASDVVAGLPELLEAVNADWASWNAELEPSALMREPIALRSLGVPTLEPDDAGLIRELTRTTRAALEEATDPSHLPAHVIAPLCFLDLISRNGANARLVVSSDAIAGISQVLKDLARALEEKPIEWFNGLGVATGYCLHAVTCFAIAQSAPQQPQSSPVQTPARFETMAAQALGAQNAAESLANVMKACAARAESDHATPLKALAVEAITTMLSHGATVPLISHSSVMGVLAQCLSWASLPSGGAAGIFDCATDFILWTAETFAPTQTPDPSADLSECFITQRVTEEFYHRNTHIDMVLEELERAIRCGDPLCGVVLQGLMEGVFDRRSRSCEQNNRSSAILCKQVLKALNDLFRGNRKNKQVFSKQIGYDSLRTLVLKSEPGGTSADMLDGMFALVVEEPVEFITEAGYSKRAKAVNNVEALQMMQEPPQRIYEPVVFSFLNGAGQGQELFVREKTFFFRSIQGNSVAETQLGPKGYLEPGCWHYVGFILEPHKIASDEAKLFIDGNTIDKLSLRIPRISSSTNNRIGSSSFVRDTSVISTFYGQIGYIQFFDEAYTCQILAQLFEIGPDYLGCFHEIDFNGTMKSFCDHLVFNYSCKAQHEKHCLNHVASAAGVQSDASVRGITACVTHDLKTIISCSDGIKVLFPLLLYVNSNSDQVNGEDMLQQIIALLTDMLNHCPSVQEEMLRCNGCSILSHLLKRVSPDFFGQRTVAYLHKMFSALEEAENLKEQFYREVLMDFTLWIYTSFDVQMEVITVLKELHRTGKMALTVEGILDVTSMFFWYTPKSYWSLCATPAEFKQVKEVHERKLSKEETKKLRMHLLDGIGLVFAKEVLPQDVNYILYLADVLRSIFPLVKCSPKLLDLLLSSSGFFVCISLLKFPSEEVRLFALSLLALVGVSYNSSMVTAAVTSVVDAIVPLRKQPNTEVTTLLLGHQLSLNRQLTESLYAALFTMAVGAVFDPTCVKFPLLVPEVVVHVLLPLLATSTTMLKHMALQDLAILLGRNNNGERLHALPGWNFPLLQLLDPAYYQDSQEYEIMVELASSLIKCIVCNSISQHRTGWQIVESHISVIRYFDQKTNGRILFRHLAVASYWQIVSFLKSEMRSYVNGHCPSIFLNFNKKTTPLLMNLVQLVALLEDFFFQTDAGLPVPDHTFTEAELREFPPQVDIEREKDILFDILDILEFAEKMMGTSSAVEAAAQAAYKLSAPSSPTPIFLLLRRCGSLQRLVALFSLRVLQLSCLAGKNGSSLDTLTQASVARIRALVFPETGEVPMARMLSMTEHSECQQLGSALLPLISELMRKCATTVANQLVSVGSVSHTQQVVAWFDSVEEAKVRALSSGQEQLCELDTNLINPELKRLELLSQETKENNDQGALHWKRTLQALKSGRGPWGAAETVLYWKVDKTENYSRMRLKKKRNYNFDKHEGCAVVYGAAPPPEGAQALPSIPLVEGKAPLAELDMEDWHKEEHDAAAEETTTLRTLLTVDCQWVRPVIVRKGTLEITLQYIFFREDRNQKPKGATESYTPKDRKWAIADIREVHLRRYLLRRSALELFFSNHTNALFNFPSQSVKQQVFNKIVYTCKPPSLLHSDSHSPADMLKKSKLTQMWQQHQLSNFDYLMALNTTAGRTYNDLTQYPVFPWILADYKSPKLDLSNPAVYRDLSKPVGALNTERLAICRERYRGLAGGPIPPFLYGSHYSSGEIVFFYLIRMEPFTENFLKMQGGKYDYADRMFDDIEMTWHNCLVSPADVKELIPEFFYLPDFLLNTNKFDLGTKQCGTKLDDIILPPWAPTPEEFIRINREALESDYVSSHLHEWIDLIFGYKQRGEEARAADNVFFYMTYEGAVDLDAIKDERERIAAEAQILHFGQTPTQLLTRPHPPRMRARPELIPMTQTPDILKAWSVQIGRTPIVFLGETKAEVYVGSAERIVTINSDRELGVHVWTRASPESQGSPFTMEVDPLLQTRRQIGVPFSGDITPAPGLYELSPDGKYIFSCGHWDGSFRVTSTETGRVVQKIMEHKDVVTCLTTSTGRMPERDAECTLVTGSRDTTIMVWDILTTPSSLRVSATPRHVLYGHDDEVTAIAASEELDVVVSGSRDGAIVVHTLRRGKFVWTAKTPGVGAISLIRISHALGHIVVYSQEQYALLLYSIDGKLLERAELHEQLFDIVITKDGRSIVTGGSNNSFVFRQLHTLKYVQKFAVSNTICCMALASGELQLLAGLRDGTMLVIGRRPDAQLSGSNFLAPPSSPAPAPSPTLKSSSTPAPV
eukprot:m51a1_g3009 putative beach domain-containing protein (2301) ;mRNA; r:833752-844561